MPFTFYNISFEYPEALIFIPVLILALIFFIYKDFIKIKDKKEDIASIRKRKLFRTLMILTRSLLIIFLLIAISSPFEEKPTTIKRDAFVKVLVDNTTSFELFDQGYANLLADRLEERIDVEIIPIGNKEESALGDAILNNLVPGDNILLVSDGHNNFGSDLSDVASYAASLNSTINAVKLDPLRNDVSVEVLGPSKTIANVDNAYVVKVTTAGNVNNFNLNVVVDGKTLIDTTTTEEVHTFTKAFDKGFHRITATVSTDKDHFPENNVFHKTVKIIPKPKVLFLTQRQSPLMKLYEPFYDLTITDSLQQGKIPFDALIVNDMPAPNLEPYMDALTEYIAEGNGMFVTGGSRSFDHGAYYESPFETLLPVFVSTAGKKEGDVSLALVIDVSTSTRSLTSGENIEKAFKIVDVEKAIALSILRDFRVNNRLAVIAFNTAAYTIAPPAFIYEHVGLEDKIAKLQRGGGTAIFSGILRAVELLEGTPGSKNIILVSDGKSKTQQKDLESADFAASKGIKIFTIGIGRNTDESTMKNIATRTGGVYFRIDEAKNLKLLFGEPDEAEEKDVNSVAILNSNHFITEGVSLNAIITGFNSITPKSTANLLVTTGSGDPILTIWRFGLGRVATLSTDDGVAFAGQLLNKDNSKILTRTLNWVIGDPSRNAQRTVDIEDTRVNEPTELVIRSDTMPVSEGLTFFKREDNVYTAPVEARTMGVFNLMGGTYAVNAPREIAVTGFNNELGFIVENSGGRLFDKNDYEGIIDSVRTRSRITLTKKVNYRVWFIIAALLLFLFEVSYRRIMENKKGYK